MLPGTANDIMASRRQVLLAVAGLLGFPWSARAATSANILELRVDYTATSLIGSDKPPATGRLWRTRRALRHEGKQGGRPLAVVARLDRNLGWLSMVGAPFAIETDLTALDLPLDVLNGGGGMRQVLEARERINGLDTMRVRVERNAGSGGRFTGHVWATDQGVVARIAGEGESRGRRGRTLMNFRDVQIGPIDAGMFEPPRGVQIVRVAGSDVVPLLEAMEGSMPFGAPR
jgi:hypothetical protein